MSFPALRLLALLLLSMRPILATEADVTLPAIFGDHMVLQQDRQLKFWGKAKPGQIVTVTIGNRTGHTATGTDGKWNLALSPLAVTSKPLTLTVTGTTKHTFTDVLVGDVWLCSGQSNMGYPLKECDTAKDGIAQADQPQIRLFVVEHHPSLVQEENVTGQWVLCTPETAAEFSAIGYYFGSFIHEDQKKPVGMIGSYFEGTPAQSWTSLAGLSRDRVLSPFIDAYWADRANWTVWTAKPVHTQSYTPTTLFNGMIAPLIPYPIKGAIWYQGEGNLPDAAIYQRMFTQLITDWRRQWGQGNFPFLYVQLANFATANNKLWPFLRDAQLKTLAVPATGMAVAIDVGDPRQLHPPDKFDVADRLALVANHVAYGKNIYYSGPLYHSSQIVGRNVRVNFTQLGGGLVSGAAPDAKPIPPNRPLTGFLIAGADRIWRPATAINHGTYITVSSAAIAHPVAVRYLWQNAPVGNLYNKAGLPASPFRTDNWEIPASYY